MVVSTCRATLFPPTSLFFSPFPFLSFPSRTLSFLIFMEGRGGMEQIKREGRGQGLRVGALPAVLWGRGDACQAVSLWPLPPLRLVEICAGAAVEGAQDALVLAGLLDTSRLPLAAGVAWTVGAGAGGLRGVSGVWLTRARSRAHAGASVGAGAGTRFGGMAFVSKEVHGEELWRLSGGGAG